MIKLSIEEPKIEQFFNHSKDEIIKTLKFIVDNDLKDFIVNTNRYELSDEQKKELDVRSKSFHDAPSIGRSWEEIKNDIQR